MPSTQNCQPCCNETTTVNVPGVAGGDGTDGSAGANGANAYTTTSADFTVPAVGGTVPVTVINSSWMVVGQPIYVGGPINAAAGTGGATFVVDSIPGITSVVLEFKGYEDDVAVATVMDSGAGVSPGGVQPNAVTASTLSEYLSTVNRDEAYDVLAVEASGQVSIISNTLSVVLSEIGTWMLTARIRVDYSYSTYGADGTPINFKLRETVNTNTDVPNSTVALKLKDATTAYHTAGVIELPPVFYTNAATSDAIQLFAWLDTLPDNPGAGNGKILAYEASLVAVRVA